jgi:hypothetical protein
MTRRFTMANAYKRVEHNCKSRLIVADIVTPEVISLLPCTFPDSRLVEKRTGQLLTEL